jgi:hypothetical protein
VAVDERAAAVPGVDRRVGLDRADEVRALASVRKPPGLIDGGLSMLELAEA